MEQGICLLLNGGKTGIEVNVHDGWLVAVKRSMLSTMRQLTSVLTLP
jgi:hypothetical protein